MKIVLSILRIVITLSIVVLIVSLMDIFLELNSIYLRLTPFNQPEGEGFFMLVTSFYSVISCIILIPLYFYLKRKFNKQ